MEGMGNVIDSQRQETKAHRFSMKNFSWEFRVLIERSMYGSRENKKLNKVDMQETSNPSLNLIKKTYKRCE